jgi:sugar phosphate isomerase/epimerase
VHVADSTRSAPGEGHTDFAPIVDALVEIDYRGFLAMEILPASANPLDVIKAGATEDFFDRFTEQSIQHMKALEPRLVIQEVSEQ